MIVFVNIALILHGCSSNISNRTDEFNIKSKPIHDLSGLDLIAELEDGNLLTISNIPDEKTNENAIFIVDQDGNNRAKLIESSYNKPIYTATLAANKWVVFAEATNDMICSDWEIKAINTENKEIYTIDNGKVNPSALKLSGTTFMAPLLNSSGSKIVWSTFEPEKDGSYIAVIRLYDLETKESKLIDQNNKESEEFGHPKIDGNYIVYDKGRIDQQAGCRFGTVYLKDITINDSVELDNGRLLSWPKKAEGPFITEYVNLSTDK